MIVVVYLIGLFAGMLRKNGWMVVPVAAIAPLALWFADVWQAGPALDDVMITCLKWGAAAAVGCFVTLMVQTHIIDAWMRENRAARLGN